MSRPTCSTGPTTPNLIAGNEELLALAVRVEAATGPDLALDAEIFCAVSPSPFTFYGDVIMAQLGGFAARVELTDIPRPTTSLDAAMKLVPEDYDWAAGSGRKEHTVPAMQSAWAWCAAPTDLAEPVTAATPVLALTAACLRARAQSTGEPV